MLKIVLDTNVLVSAILSKGKPFELAQLGFKGKFMIITSESALDELFDVLERSKFQPARKEMEIVSRAMNSCRKIKLKSSLKVVVQDSKDDIIVNTAIDGRADYIVTGDKHLLEIGRFKWIKIVTVDEMLKKLGH